MRTHTQGISGKHIKFDSKTESYLLDPALGLNASVRDTVLCMCELGWLYNRVAGYLQSSLASSADTKGVVVQAFGFALQVDYCCDVYYLLYVCKYVYYIPLLHRVCVKNVFSRVSD